MNVYVKILLSALKKFYQNDARQLWSEVVPAHEQTMSGCLYRYMWEELSLRKLENDIDMEYNRYSIDGKKRIIASDEICLKSGCSEYERCMRIIKAKSDELLQEGDAAKEFRPDIIIHNRAKGGVENNLLLVEVKKETACQADADWDRAKITYESCGLAGDMRYAIVGMVMLRQEYADVGIKVGEGDFVTYRVSCDKYDQMDSQDIERPVWCKVEKEVRR